MSPQQLAEHLDNNYFYWVSIVVVGTGSAGILLVLLFQRRYPILDKRNPGAIILLFGWSLSYAILGYKESMSTLRARIQSLPAAEKVAEFQEGRQLAETSAVLHALGVFGLLFGGLWLVVGSDKKRQRQRFVDSLEQVMMQWEAVMQPALLYEHTADGPKVIVANHLARNFYNYEGDGIIGQRPLDIYQNMAGKMPDENLVAVQEENRKRAELAKKHGFDASTTDEPQILNEKHHFFRGKFFCSTIPIEFAGARYYLTLLRPESQFSDPKLRKSREPNKPLAVLAPKGSPPIVTGSIEGSQE